MTYSRQPALDAIVEAMHHHAPGILGGTGLVCVQHLVPSALPLFRALVRSQVRPEHIVVLGKTYSSNPSVVKELTEMGIYVLQESQPTKPGHFRETILGDVKRLWVVARSRLRETRSIVVLDDGGRAIAACPAWARKRRATGVEQTSSGWRRMLDHELKIPFVSVARSGIKLVMESPVIGEAVTNALSERHLLNSRGVIGVLGLGPIGRAVCESLGRMGKSVATYDPTVPQITTNNFTWRAKSISEVLAECALILGCTGVDALRRSDLQGIPRMGKRILASCSSEDREFRWIILHGSATRSNDNLFCTVDDRQFRIEHNGFPINFVRGGERERPESMQFTRAILLAGVFQAACIGARAPRDPKIYRLDGELQELIVASADRFGLDAHLRRIVENVANWDASAWTRRSGGVIWPTSGVMQNCVLGTWTP